MTINDFLKNLSERIGRTVTFGPTTFVDGVPRKKLFLDGIPLDFKWSPEESGSFSEFRSQEEMEMALIDSIVEAINAAHKEST